MTTAPDDERCLPEEILVRVLNFLDVYSIARLAQTCRFLYQLSRDEQRVWKPRTLASWPECHFNDIIAYGASWRRMYYERPRVRRDGVYISHCKYIRHVRPIGNIHTIDSDAAVGRGSPTRPPFSVEPDVLAVSYRRYLKFIDETRVLILRSEVPDVEAIAALKSFERTHCHPADRRRRAVQWGGRDSPEEFQEEDQLNTGGTGVSVGGSKQQRRQQRIAKAIMVGQYGISSTSVGILYAQGSSSTDPAVYRLSLALSHVRSSAVHHRYNSKLTWIDFSIDEPGEETYRINIDTVHFKPYYFNRIRSYDFMF